MKFSEQMLLITKGYSKKEIQELKDMEAEELKASMTEEAPDEESVKEVAKTEEEPDYKKLYEELLAKHEKTEEDLKDIRDKNIRSNAAPAAEDIKKKQEDTLVSIARSFM